MILLLASIFSLTAFDCLIITLSGLCLNAGFFPIPRDVGLNQETFFCRQMQEIKLELIHLKIQAIETKMNSTFMENLFEYLPFKGLPILTMQDVYFFSGFFLGTWIFCFVFAWRYLNSI